MQTTWNIAILAATLSLFMSCAINPRLETEAPTVKDQQLSNAVIKVPMPAPQQSVESTSIQGYRLGFGDVLEVKFFNNPEYNEVVAVRPDGNISLQRVGDVQVIGMPVSRLDSLVTRVYSEILLQPDVTIFVREFGGQNVYVMGEVEKPGQYNFVKGMSILRAIATAGGPLRSAKLNSIILVRGDENRNLVVNRLDLATKDLASMLKHDQPVRPYDLIYIPRSFIADMDAFVGQLYNVILPPLTIYSRLAYLNKEW